VSTEFLAKNTKMVYTFEPMQANFLATRKRVGNYSNVRLHNFALDNFVGAADLYDNSFIDGSPSLYGTRGYNKSSTVDVRKLDDFKLHDATTLISDCEGAEVGLLKGGLNTLENIKVAIVEVHCVKGRWTRSEVESVLLSKGFFKITFYPGYAKYIGPMLQSENINCELLSIIGLNSICSLIVF
jgi:FkbM family methyltransferase